MTSIVCGGVPCHMVLFICLDMERMRVNCLLILPVDTILRALHITQLQMENGISVAGALHVQFAS